MLIFLTLLLAVYSSLAVTARTRPDIHDEWSSEVVIKQLYGTVRKVNSQDSGSSTKRISRVANRFKNSNSEVAKMKDPLESFVSCLKSFVFDTNFAVDTFESAAESLEEELSEISFSISQVHSSVELLDQLKFAKYMFDAMVDSIEPLRHFDLMGSLDVHLVHCMIDLNIRLLALYDSHGLPDSKIPGYSYEVNRYSELMRQWEQEFQSLTLVRYGVRLMFRKQYSQADLRILFLKSYIMKGV